MESVQTYFNEIGSITSQIDCQKLTQQIEILANLKASGGRLFILGVGGSAANASHAVNDFRKICHIETYAPTDNVSELTARTNDEGWETVFASWLEISGLNENDVLYILSVGGGNKEKNVSVNLVRAIEYALTKNVKILGVVGREDGYAVKASEHVFVVPQVNSAMITPYVESFQSVVLHCLVSHPNLSREKTKW